MPPDRPVRSASSGGSPLLATPLPEVWVKPLLRGVLHQYAFFVSLASGTLLVLLATTTKATAAAALYGASVSPCSGSAPCTTASPGPPRPGDGCAGWTTP
jgi:hypothetical protein